MLPLTLTLSSKNRKIKNKIKNEKENKKKLSPLSAILTLQLLLQIPTRNPVGMLQVTYTVHFQARCGSIVQHDHFVSVYIEY